MDIPKLISLANNLTNPADADALKSAIYQLQKENIDFKVKYQECFAKLQELDNWEKTKVRYKEHKTNYGSVVYIKVEKSTPDIYYCPVCFSNKSIVPLQKFSPDIANKFKIHDFQNHQMCPSCNATFYIIGR